jgi:ABC-2 type transport system ATP-binding protein
VTSRLEKRFEQRLAVSDVSLELHPGEVVALLGPNGAGKTTTLRLLAGLLRPTSGTVIVGGVPQDERTWRATRARIGLLTETPGLWDRLTVEANLTTYALLHRLPDAAARVRSLLGQFDLADRAREPTANLTKGMRQKVALARALLHDPDIVLLDEPTAGLDPAMTRTVRTLIAQMRSAGRAVLLSTHLLDEAERVADRVAVLQHTLVALDTPAALRARGGTDRVDIDVAATTPELVEAARRAACGQVTVTGRTLSCEITRAEIDVPRLVRALVEAGADVQRVISRVPTLEDAYLAMTRDAAAGSQESSRHV